MRDLYQESFRDIHLTPLAFKQFKEQDYQEKLAAFLKEIYNSQPPCYDYFDKQNYVTQFFSLLYFFNKEVIPLIKRTDGTKTLTTFLNNIYKDDYSIEDEKGTNDQRSRTNYYREVKRAFEMLVFRCIELKNDSSFNFNTTLEPLFETLENCNTGVRSAIEQCLSHISMYQTNNLHVIFSTYRDNIVFALAAEVYRDLDSAYHEHRKFEIIKHLAEQGIQHNHRELILSVEYDCYLAPLRSRDILLVIHNFFHRFNKQALVEYLTKYYLERIEQLIGDGRHFDGGKFKDLQDLVYDFQQQGIFAISDVLAEGELVLVEQKQDKDDPKNKKYAKEVVMLVNPALKANFSTHVENLLIKKGVIHSEQHMQALLESKDTDVAQRFIEENCLNNRTYYIHSLLQYAIYRKAIPFIISLIRNEVLGKNEIIQLALLICTRKPNEFATEIMLAIQETGKYDLPAILTRCFKLSINSQNKSAAESFLDTFEIIYKKTHYIHPDFIKALVSSFSDIADSNNIDFIYRASEQTYHQAVDEAKHTLLDHCLLKNNIVAARRIMCTKDINYNKKTLENVFHYAPSLLLHALDNSDKQKIKTEHITAFFTAKPCGHHDSIYGHILTILFICENATKFPQVNKATILKTLSDHLIKNHVSLMKTLTVHPSLDEYPTSKQQLFLSIKEAVLSILQKTSNKYSEITKNEINMFLTYRKIIISLEIILHVTPTAGKYLRVTVPSQHDFEHASTPGESSCSFHSMKNIFAFLYNIFYNDASLFCNQAFYEICFSFIKANKYVDDLSHLTAYQFFNAFISDKNPTNLDPSSHLAKIKHAITESKQEIPYISSITFTEGAHDLPGLQCNPSTMFQLATNLISLNLSRQTSDSTHCFFANINNQHMIAIGLIIREGEATWHEMDSENGEHLTLLWQLTSIVCADKILLKKYAERIINQYKLLSTADQTKLEQAYNDFFKFCTNKGLLCVDATNPVIEEKYMIQDHKQDSSLIEEKNGTKYSADLNNEKLLSLFEFNEIERNEILHSFNGNVFLYLLYQKQPQHCLTLLSEKGIKLLSLQQLSHVFYWYCDIQGRTFSTCKQAIAIARIYSALTENLSDEGKIQYLTFALSPLLHLELYDQLNYIIKHIAPLSKNSEISTSQLIETSRSLRIIAQGLFQLSCNTTSQAKRNRLTKHLRRCFRIAYDILPCNSQDTYIDKIKAYKLLIGSTTKMPLSETHYAMQQLEQLICLHNNYTSTGNSDYLVQRFEMELDLDLLKEARASINLLDFLANSNTDNLSAAKVTSLKIKVCFFTTQLLLKTAIQLPNKPRQRLSLIAKIYQLLIKAEKLGAKKELKDQIENCRLVFPAEWKAIRKAVQEKKPKAQGQSQPTPP